MHFNYFEYNPHPQGKNVGDCVKRAFTRATGMDYMEVQRELNRLKKELGEPHFNSDKVWRTFLARHHFVKHSFPAVAGESRMTVAKLAEESDFNDVWVCRCARHLVCVTQNGYWDTWDSGDKCVYTAFKLIKK